MRVRHRTPSIFSISMVDVLCCALGCMILMWINKSDENEATAKNLVNLSARLKTTEEKEKRRLTLAQSQEQEPEHQGAREERGRDIAS